MISDNQEANLKYVGNDCRKYAGECHARVENRTAARINLQKEISLKSIFIEGIREAEKREITIRRFKLFKQAGQADFSSPGCRKGYQSARSLY
jgi:hypothetical protein